MLSDTKTITVNIGVDDLPGLLEFTEKWLGSYWPDAWFDFDAPGENALPLHVPGGFALGVALLAERHGLEGQATFTLREELTQDCWILNGRLRSRRFVLPNWPEQWEGIRVPALADIPADHPDPQREAMAIRACLLALPAPAEVQPCR